MTRTLTIAYHFSHEYKEKIFMTLVVLIVLAVCGYAFLLQKTIVNVVQRQQVITEVKTVAIDLSDLEEQYFSAKNKITRDLAHSRGLKDPQYISYISKKSLTAMASTNEL